jgi:hypothetical protein
VSYGARLNRVVIGAYDVGNVELAKKYGVVVVGHHVGYGSQPLGEAPRQYYHVKPHEPPLQLNIS